MPGENEKYRPQEQDFVLATQEQKTPETRPVAESQLEVREQIDEPFDRTRDVEATKVLETALSLAEPVGTSSVSSVDKETEKYLVKYLPEYLRYQTVIGSTINKAVNLFFRLKEKFGSFRVEGRENIPTDGSFLIVSNHRGGETGKILALFGDKKVHISAGEELNFKRSKFRESLLRKLGFIPVKESLVNLSEEGRKNLLLKVPDRSRSGYEAVLAKENLPLNREFIRSSVASLAKGEPVVVFPEGLFTYEGDELRQAYGGWELIAREYKNVTGKDLPILPVGLTRDSASIGQTVTLSEVENTNGLMKKVARLLPLNMRGVYKE